MVEEMYRIWNLQRSFLEELLPGVFKYPTPSLKNPVFVCRKTLYCVCCARFNTFDVKERRRKKTRKDKTPTL